MPDNVVDNLTVRVDGDLLPIERSLKNARAKTTRAGRHMTRSFDTVDRSVNRLRQSIGRLPSILGALAVGVAARAIVQTNARFQDLQLTLDTVFGSMRKGQDAMSFVRDFATRTPFDIETLTRSMIQLQGAGVEPTEELLTTLGDAASATTNRMATLESLVRVTTRAIGGGLGLEELEQLVNQGLPVYQILQDEIGVTRQEISDLGQTAEGAGRIMDALHTGLNRRFSGGMERAANQLSVALSNLGIQGQNVILALGDGVGGDDGLTDATRDLALAMTDLLASIEPLARILGSTLALGLNAVSGVLTVISGTIDAIGDGIEKLEEIGNGKNSQFANFQIGGATGLARESDIAERRRLQSYFGGGFNGEANLSLTASHPTNRFLANRGSRGSERAVLNDATTESPSTFGFLATRGSRGSERSVLRAHEATENIVEFTEAESRAIEETSNLDDALDSLGQTLSSSLADALVDGELSLNTLLDSIKDFAKQALAEFLRVQVFQRGLSYLFGGPDFSFGAGAHPGERQGGGSTNRNMPYLVGERGPEIFVPHTAGRIMNNPSMGMSGGGITFNQVNNIDLGAAQSARAEALAVAPIIEARSVAAVKDLLQRGGSYAAPFRR